MPTRTPAEKERIKKKRERESLLIKAVASIMLLVFVFICEKKGCFTKADLPDGSSASPTKQTEIDLRLEYLERLCVEAEVVSEDSAVASVTGASGVPVQLIVKGKEGPVSVKIVAEFARYTAPGFDPILFPNVDRVTEKREDSMQKLAPVCSSISAYISPLYPAGDVAELEEKLADALYEFYAYKALSGQIIWNAYTVALSFDEANGLLSVEASPAS